MLAVWVISCTVRVYCDKDIEILTEEITLPPDRPRCGFYNELCPQDNSGNRLFVSVSLVFYYAVSLKDTGKFELK